MDSWIHGFSHSFSSGATLSYLYGSPQRQRLRYEYRLVLNSRFLNNMSSSFLVIVCFGFKVSQGLRCLGDWPAFKSHEDLARDPWSRYYDVSMIVGIGRTSISQEVLRLSRLSMG